MSHSSSHPAHRVLGESPRGLGQKLAALASLNASSGAGVPDPGGFPSVVYTGSAL